MILVILDVVGEVMDTIEIVVDEQAEGGAHHYIEKWLDFQPHGWKSTHLGRKKV